ncbi:MAG: PIN domain-containing protein [Chloroflexota bacterium]
MSTRTAYLDTSAIVRLVLPGPGTDELMGLLRGIGSRVTSTIATVEVPRLVASLDPGSVARAGEVLARLATVALDPALVAVATSLRPPTLPAAGAIHVASALLLADALDAFLTYDPAIAAAARAASLRVESPGVELAAPASPEEGEADVAAGSLGEADLMRVVDRLVGRLRPERIVLPVDAPVGRGGLTLAMVPGPWSPGRGASWVAQEAIEDLDVRLELILVDEDTPEPAGRVLYQLP